MTPDFSIDIVRWENPIHGSPEVAATAAEISVMCGHRNATMAYDKWARSTREEVFLSAYPLALWLAESWWRLQWEPAPIPPLHRTTSWRMAHEMPAAGHGFLWPSLTFFSDGDFVEIICSPSEIDSQEPLRYLSNFNVSVPLDTFEGVLSNFIDTVLARLYSMRESNSDLKNLWQWVLEERADTYLSFRRQLEARLGYDMEEAPEGLLNDIHKMAANAGNGAIAEIASGVADGDPVSTFATVQELAKTQGVQGKIEVPKNVQQKLKKIRRGKNVPWERGRQLANMARRNWNLNGDIVADKHLLEILQISETTFGKFSPPNQQRLPLGLSIKKEGSEQLNFLFRARQNSSRRFEAARFLADWLMESEHDLWFPATDAKTARQKVQRAFAAEFLCPIESLTEFLNTDFSEDKIEDAAAHFAVSSWTILSHLVNHGKLSRDFITWDW